MAKPKPQEDLDSITVRPPIQVADKCRALAKASGCSLNAWLVAVIEHAADQHLLVETVTRVATDQPNAKAIIESDPAYQAWIERESIDRQKREKDAIYLPGDPPPSARLNDSDAPRNEGKA